MCGCVCMFMDASGSVGLFMCVFVDMRGRKHLKLIKFDDFWSMINFIGFSLYRE